MENWECYWAWDGEEEVDGKYIPEIFCRLDGYSKCDLLKPCRRLVRYDMIDEYIKHLLEELDYYYKLP